MPDDPRSSEPTPDTAPDDRGDSTGQRDDASYGRHRIAKIAILGAAGLAAAVLLVFAFTAPRVTSGVATDRLGPAPGEQVDDYLNQARASLDGTDTDLRWALLTPTDYLTPQQIPDAAHGLRVAGVIQYVPIDRVQTPVITVAVPAGAEPAVQSAEAAAGLLAAQQFHDQRSADIARVTEVRLRAGCACTAGLVVRGTLPELRELAAQPGVRSVQALPADALAGRFAVSPLLPGTTGAVTPTPDDGPVPTE
ncbi:hypothetical protein [Nocardia sp. AG03]|uniref:hypothetical protein n=1 Tax=Nocardia sp. AG03 TaxID=3025312 RepID=UPI0024189A7A|nr:hypothetical protein [Nocardia sp. AG03]